MNLHKFQLFADYFQLYITDDNSKTDTSDIWNDKSLEFKLAVSKSTLAIGTFRNMDVLLEIEICTEEPNINLEEWDHASKGYLTIETGRCVVFGCTDYLPDAKRVDLPNGNYSAISLAKGLNTITEEWEDAEDLYKVYLWPSSVRDYKSLKQYENT